MTMNMTLSGLNLIGFSFFGRPLKTLRSEKGIQIINGPKFLEEKFSYRGMF